MDYKTIINIFFSLGIFFFISSFVVMLFSLTATYGKDKKEFQPYIIKKGIIRGVNTDDYKIDKQQQLIINGIEVNTDDYIHEKGGKYFLYTDNEGKFIKNCN